jgi:ATP-dependent RNA helicase DDX31/DBP7
MDRCKLTALQATPLTHASAASSAAASSSALLLSGVLRSRLRRSREAKLVVFFSNCDSVDFHHALLQQPQPGSSDQDTAAAAAGDEAGELLLGSCPVLKLHGDMKQPERTSSLVTFSKVRPCSSLNLTPG